MIQDIYQKAILFAGEKHKDQNVPGTHSNYVVHLSNVAMEILMAYSSNPNFDIDFAIQLALLHDTIEDTQTDFNEIKSAFGERVAHGVLALTKDHNIESKHARMKDSLSRINALEKEVGMVKLADRITNLQAPPKFWSKEKIFKYLEEAITINDILQNKNDYLNTRLNLKIDEYSQYAR